MTDERLFTVEQVAERLSVDPETVRRWLRSGKLSGVRLGAARAGWRIPESALAAMIETPSTPASTARPLSRVTGTPPRRLPHAAQPDGLAPLLERAEHFRLAGNLAEAARWQRLADQLLAESSSVE